MRYFLTAAIVATCVAIVGGYAALSQVPKHSDAQKNLDDAESYRAQAERGDPRAQYELGHLFFEGRGVPQDYEESVYWYRAAADQGWVPALSSLGFMYEQGLGVPKDNAEALVYYQKAADHGDADAEYNLGTMCRLGMGMPRNYTEAVKWYRMASNQGDPNGQYGLGYMYYNGEGVAQDFVMAASLYRKAADQGLARAQYDLAYMYYDGRGVEQSRTEADRLLHQAAAQGEPRAQRSLKRVDATFWSKRKIISLIIFVGCSLFFVTSFFPTRGHNLKRRRTRIIAGVVGLSYASLDLYSSFSQSIAHFGISMDEISFARFMLLGIFTVLLIMVITQGFKDAGRLHQG